MEEEIARAPRIPISLRIACATIRRPSPKDAGRGPRASWEDVNESGSEAVGGDNPTPDQSMVEENAHAVA